MSNQEKFGAILAAAGVEPQGRSTQGSADNLRFDFTRDAILKDADPANRRGANAAADHLEGIQEVRDYDSAIDDRAAQMRLQGNGLVELDTETKANITQMLLDHHWLEKRTLEELQQYAITIKAPIIPQELNSDQREVVHTAVKAGVVQATSAYVILASIKHLQESEAKQQELPAEQLFELVKQDFNQIKDILPELQQKARELFEQKVEKVKGAKIERLMYPYASENNAPGMAHSDRPLIARAENDELLPPPALRDLPQERGGRE